MSNNLSFYNLSGQVFISIEEVMVRALKDFGAMKLSLP